MNARYETHMKRSTVRYETCMKRCLRVSPGMIRIWNVYETYLKRHERSRYETPGANILVFIRCFRFIPRFIYVTYPIRSILFVAGSGGGGRSGDIISHRFIVRFIPLSSVTVSLAFYRPFHTPFHSYWSGVRNTNPYP